MFIAAFYTSACLVSGLNRNMQMREKFPATLACNSDLQPDALFYLFDFDIYTGLLL